MAGCSVSSDASGTPDHVTLTSHVASALVPVPRRGLPQPLMTRLQMTRRQEWQEQMRQEWQERQERQEWQKRQTLRLLLMEARSCPPPRSGRRAF